MSDLPEPKENITSTAPKQRRASRYQKVQARRAAQERSDQRFYNSIFALIGFTSLLAILLGAIGINGMNVDTSGMAGWTVPWLGPFSKLEIAGLVLISVIALSVYLRMRKRG